MGVRAREKVLWFFGQNIRVMEQNVVDVGFFVSLVAGEDTGLTCKVLEALPSLPFRYTYIEKDILTNDECDADITMFSNKSIP